jgi:alpha-ketoglutarate-dependent taurine dioxygenase
MTNPRESGGWTDVGPHNTIGVAMEDLPEAERKALQKELEEEGARVFPKNMHGGDQENHPSRHNYGNCYIFGNSKPYPRRVG